MTCSAAHCICKHNIVHNHSCFIAIRSHCSLWPPTAAAAPPKTHAHTPFAFSHQSSLGIRQLLSIVDLTLGSTLLRWRIVAERCLCQERAYPFALATLLYIKYQTSEGQYADLLWPPHIHTRTKATHPPICTQTRKHTHTLENRDTHTQMLAYSDTHTHKRSESSSQLTSPTCTCLDFFPSPPYPSDDVFATSGGTRYIHGHCDTTLVGGRERESAREREKAMAACDGKATEGKKRGKKEQGRVRESGGHRRTDPLANPSWAVEPQTPQNSTAKRLGYPLVGAWWQLGRFGFVCGGAGAGAGGGEVCYESIRVRGQASWVAVTSWQWDTSRASKHKLIHSAELRLQAPLFPHIHTLCQMVKEGKSERAEG